MMVVSQVPTIENVINRFNQGCASFQRAMNAWQDGALIEYQNALNSAATEVVGALEWVLRIYLMSKAISRTSRIEQFQLNDNPTFHTLVSMMKRYAVPALSDDEVSMFYDYRTLRNSAEHYATVPDSQKLYEAIEFTRQFVTRYLQVEDGKLKNVRLLTGQVKSRVANPFGLVDRIEDPARYLVRQPLTDQMMNELRKGVNISVVGETHTGRTSLLLHLCRGGPKVLGRPAADFLYLDLQLVHNEDDFFEAICHDLGLASVRRGIRLARTLRGRRIVLCLDEAEKLTRPSFTVDFRAELRGLASGARAPFTMVITSRSPLQTLFPDSPQHSSPIYNIFLNYQMPYFTLDEARALVEQQLAGTNLRIPDREIAGAWQRSFGHPANLQQELKQVFAKRFES
ncbi:MAG: hypothetical protein ACPGWR_29165 [Ardenticatenaceae bacterium]